MLARFLRLLRSFYATTLIGLVVWMLFFDANDLVGQVRNWLKLRELQGETAWYDQKIAEVKRAKREVLGSPALREKYAREHYLMKRRTEDVYVVVDEKNEPLEKE
jgi:cell division protein DivIC